MKKACCIVSPKVAARLVSNFPMLGEAYLLADTINAAAESSFQISDHLLNFGRNYFHCSRRVGRRALLRSNYHKRQRQLQVPDIEPHDFSWLFSSCPPFPIYWFWKAEELRLSHWANIFRSYLSGLSEWKRLLSLSSLRLLTGSTAERWRGHPLLHQQLRSHGANASSFFLRRLCSHSALGGLCLPCPPRYAPALCTILLTMKRMNRTRCFVLRIGRQTRPTTATDTNAAIAFSVVGSLML